MRKNQRSLFLSTIGLLIVLGLATGCYKPAAPDVTATPAAGAQAVPEGGTPGAQATSIADATLTAQPAGAGTSPVATPTSPPPTPFPTIAPPTSVPTLPPTSVPPPTAPPTGGTTHVVQRGENLFRISLRYGTTVQAVASANGIANPALIYVGQVLKIPSPGTQPGPQPGGDTYVVQPGDNLFRIALRYGMSHLQLAQYNSIANPSRIYVGQVLRIPPH